MLPYTEYGTGDLTLVLMPFLGGSQREWTETVALLTKHARCVTLDLPGFGEAANIPGYTVAAMAASLTETLAALRLGRYVLVGHSMAGKLSAVVARQLTDAGNPLPPPIALVLVAPSPPGPEPMTDAKRAQMLESLGAPNPPRKQAEAYIRENSTRPLPPDRVNRTVDEVLKMNPAAWTAWLEAGSKEDWGDRVGLLPLPVLILAAIDDGALGPDVQREHTLPHFPAGHIIAVECGHLVPIEEPEELAALIANFLKVL